jgi:hypothetical protein
MINNIELCLAELPGGREKETLLIIYYCSFRLEEWISNLSWENSIDESNESLVEFFE